MYDSARIKRSGLSCWISTSRIQLDGREGPQLKTKNLLRLSIYLTLPSLALSAASLVVVGGLYRDAIKESIADKKRISDLSELVVATSRQMRQTQADLNGDLDYRISAALSVVAVRLDAVERASIRTKIKPDAKVRSVSALPER